MTTDTVVKCPPAVTDFTKRLLSEEGRINWTEKMVSIYVLRGFEFQDRQDLFHWDLKYVVELQGKGNVTINDGEGENCNAKQDDMDSLRNIGMEEDEFTHVFTSSRDHTHYGDRPTTPSCGSNPRPPETCDQVDATNREQSAAKTTTHRTLDVLS